MSAIREKKTPPGVMLYFDVYDAIKMLPQEDVIALIDAMVKYTRDGEKPALSSTLQCIWLMLEPKLDYNLKSYSDVCTQRRYAVYCRECKVNETIALSYEDWQSVYNSI